jgi:hypothetical protein
VLFDVLFDPEMMDYNPEWSTARASGAGTCSSAAATGASEAGVSGADHRRLLAEERERTYHHKHAALERNPELHAALVAKFRNAADFPIINASKFSSAGTTRR